MNVEGSVGEGGERKSVGREKGPSSSSLLSMIMSNHRHG